MPGGRVRRIRAGVNVAVDLKKSTHICRKVPKLLTKVPQKSRKITLLAYNKM